MLTDDHTLALLAAANDEDTQDVRIVYDAIVLGLTRGPVGVLEELTDLGLTLGALDKAEETIRDLRAEIDTLASPAVKAPPKRRTKVA